MRRSMQKHRKQFHTTIYNQSILVLGLIVGLLVATNVLYAWTGPSTTAPGGNISTPLNTSATDQVKAGGLWVGALNANGEIVSTLNGYGQLRMVAGNFGAFWRNDGADTYFLLTNSGDQYGGWNNLRPFWIHDSDGTVNIGTQLCLNGVCRTSWPNAAFHASGVHGYKCPYNPTNNGNCNGQFFLANSSYQSCYTKSCSTYTNACGGTTTSCTQPTWYVCTDLGNIVVQ